MQIEISLVMGIILAIILYSNKNELKKFIVGENSDINFFKEKDYNFYVLAKYGDGVDPNVLYSKRVRLTGYVSIFLFLIFITNLTAMNILTIIAGIIIIYKMPYISLKTFLQTQLKDLLV